MALKRNERYPGRFANPTSAHPQGGFKNRSSPSAQDGSYLEADWANDWDGFFSRLLTVASLTPNGAVDSASSSQYFDALVAAIKLNLGTAATRNVGTAATNIPDISSFTSNLQSSGYQKLPGGLIVQWDNVTAGLINSPTNGTLYTFPIAFTQGCLQIVCSYDNGQSGGTTIYAGAAQPVANNTYRVRCGAASGTYNFRILAVGI